MVLRIAIDQIGFGGSHIFSVNSANSFALIMDLKHYTCGVAFGVEKKIFQQFNHKFHRRKIIVEKNYLEHGGLLQLWRSFLNDYTVLMPA